MNTRDQLNQYLQGLEKRMRWLAVSRGAAVAAGVALGATLALVLITNALAFSSTSMTVARVVLFVDVLRLCRQNGEAADAKKKRGQRGARNYLGMFHRLIIKMHKIRVNPGFSNIGEPRVGERTCFWRSRLASPCVPERFTIKV